MALSRTTLWLWLAIQQVCLLSAVQSSPVGLQPVKISPAVSAEKAPTQPASDSNLLKVPGNPNQAAPRTQGKRQADGSAFSRRNEDPWFLDQAPLPLQPYKFAYDVKDPSGFSRQYRQEAGDGQFLTGSYGYTLPDGIYRHVDYVADERGFRAFIRTSEPGTANQNPASVVINANPPPVATPNIQFTRAPDPLAYNQLEYNSLRNDIELARQRQLLLYGQAAKSSLENSAQAPARPRGSQSTQTQTPYQRTENQNFASNLDANRAGGSSPSNYGTLSQDQVDQMDIRRVFWDKSASSHDRRDQLFQGDFSQPTPLEPWTQKFGPTSQGGRPQFADSSVGKLDRPSPFDLTARLPSVGSVNLPPIALSRASIYAIAGPKTGSSAFRFNYDRLLSGQGSGGAQESKLSYNNKHLFHHETPFLSLERSRGIAQLNQLNSAARGLNYIRPPASNQGTSVDEGTLSLNDMQGGSYRFSARRNRVDEPQPSEPNVISKFNSSTITVSTEFEVKQNSNSLEAQGQLPPPEPSFSAGTKTGPRPSASRMQMDGGPFAGLKGANSRLRAPYSQFAPAKNTARQLDASSGGDELTLRPAARQQDASNQEFNLNGQSQVSLEPSTPTTQTPTTNGPTTQSPDTQPGDVAMAEATKSRDGEQEQTKRTPSTSMPPSAAPAERADDASGASGRENSELVKRSYHRGKWTLSSIDAGTLTPIRNIRTPDEQDSLVLPKLAASSPRESMDDFFESQRISGEVRGRSGENAIAKTRQSSANAAEPNASVSYDEEPTTEAARARQTFNFLDPTYQQYQKPKRDSTKELFRYDDLLGSQPHYKPPGASLDTSMDIKPSIGLANSVRIQLNEAADSAHGSIMEPPKRLVAKIERSSEVEGDTISRNGFTIGQTPNVRGAAAQGFYEVVAKTR